MVMENVHIEIVYQDEYFLAVNKPVNLPVHKNEFMPKDADYLLKSVGKQINKGVFNVHRLDSKTSGLILLTLSEEAAHLFALMFERKEIQKTYHAIVKGIPEEEGIFDEKVLIKKKGRKANALTAYKRIETYCTNMQTEKDQEISFSLVEINPSTGKWHQIRQHFSKNRFDIIGDTHHGDWSLNKLITNMSGLKRLFLHASRLSFTHPFTKNEMIIDCPLPDEFHNLITFFNENK